MNYRLPAILLVCCVIIGIAVKIFCGSHPEYDFTALIVADIVMFLLSIAAWAMFRKNAGERPAAFVRGMQGASMLRLFVCVIGVLAYALIKKPNLHKPSLFVMLSMYVIYMVIETLYFSRVAKKA